MRPVLGRYAIAPLVLVAVASGAGERGGAGAVQERLDTAASDVPWREMIGREVSVPRRLHDGEEFVIPLRELLQHGERLFTAMWTGQEGGGRPLAKGNGASLANPGAPLIFPRNFNRVSAPDANSCAGCHNLPATGGGGDVVTNVFVLAQRFDFATFNTSDVLLTQGAYDEAGIHATLQSVGNSRATIGMFGSGYIEMLARQMTADLQAIRDTIPPGGSAALMTKGVSFGRLTRWVDGTWDVSQVEGLVAPSLQTTGPSDPPGLLIRPFHQASHVVSLRQFTNNAPTITTAFSRPNGSAWAPTRMATASPTSSHAPMSRRSRCSRR